MPAELRFDKNGKFKIMLMGDPHESARVGKSFEMKTRDFLVFQNMALDAEKPDLVVFMGDNTSADTTAELEKTIERITAPIRARNIPLAVIIGNHDLEAKVSDMSAHIEAYKKYDRSLYPNAEQMSCDGDYNALIMSRDSDCPVFNLWFMYSGNTAPEKYNSKYAFVTDRQINWYEQRARELRELNGGKVIPAMLFQHIPVPEELELLKETSPARYAFDAVMNKESGKRRYFVLDRAKGVVGYMGEYPCPPSYNNGQFASWKKTGDIIAAFFGHDHLNDFVGCVDGITLGQCKTSGFRPYGDGLGQAVRIIELSENNPCEFNTYMMRYRDIVGNFCQSIHGETRIMPDRVSTRFEAALKIAAVTAAAAVGITAVRRKKK